MKKTSENRMTDRMSGMKTPYLPLDAYANRKVRSSRKRFAHLRTVAIVSFAFLASLTANSSFAKSSTEIFQENDCADVVGQVFDDKNANGYQDDGERGIPNVRIVSVNGQIVTTDGSGSFHFACPMLPVDHGSNFVVKLDEQTLPTGYRMTTENPRDARLTPGKVSKINLGATIQRVIRAELNACAYVDGKLELLPLWDKKLVDTTGTLKERPSVLRLVYAVGKEGEAIGRARLDQAAEKMRVLWKQKVGDEKKYPLLIEKELIPAKTRKVMVTKSVVMETVPAAGSFAEVKDEKPTMYGKTLDEEHDSGPMFERGRAELTSGTKIALDSMAEELKGRRITKVLVVGHTDNEKLSAGTRANFKTNLGLSQARATNVGEYLRKGLGLATNQIYSKGVGESKPISDNKTVQGRAKNRRVEIEVWYEKESTPRRIAMTPIPAPIKETVVDDVCMPFDVVEETVIVPVKGNIQQVPVVERVTSRMDIDRNFYDGSALVGGNMFENGGVTLTGQGRVALDKLADELKGRKHLALIAAAHADSQESAAAQLTETRAQVVATYLRTKLASQTQDVAYQGFAASKPVASNDSAEGRAKNRRVEIKATFDDERRVERVIGMQSVITTEGNVVTAGSAIAANQSTSSERILGATAGIAPSLTADAQKVFRDQTGKRIDNARVGVGAVPLPTEVEPAQNYKTASTYTKTERRSIGVPTTRQEPVVNRVKQVVMERTLAEGAGGALFNSGKATLTLGAITALDKLAKDVRGKSNLGFEVAGHTDNQRLSAPTKKSFGDNQGLSQARASTVAAYLQRSLGLTGDKFKIDGYGETRPIASNDTVEGMSRNRRVEIKVAYDQSVEKEVVTESTSVRSVAGPTITKLVDVTTGCVTPLAGGVVSPLNITIDGVPVEADGKVIEEDRQRCTDVAASNADIQIRYDALAINPELNVWATPNGAQRGKPVEFRAWSNYINWIKKSEIRIFRRGQQPTETPMAILNGSWKEAVTWMPTVDQDAQFAFLMRVYDEKGKFDETSLKSLVLLSQAPNNNDAQAKTKEEWTGYGENSLALRNIRVSGGTVTVNGSSMKAGQKIEALGLALPVDRNGKFAIKQIMPSGPNTVNIKVTETNGQVAEFERNLTIADSNWFYVVLGDLTVGRNSTSGPVVQVTGDTQHYDNKTYVDGRGAFYLKGKIKGDWLLTASADTREQPLKDVFSNFSSKDPRYLLRNVNPDDYYPVYGDDSSRVDDAPTMGKLYVKLQKDDSYVMWGNYRTTWNGTELLQYSRGLYGVNARYRSESATSYGEKATQIDAFASKPGTLGVREDLRGTGGSLYYLKRQVITEGSERVWVETRDADSGLAIERKLLVQVQDYEINYLQGRVVLRDPLSSTVSSKALIGTSGLKGNQQYMVVTYEYAPGLEVDRPAGGVRASQWIGDNVQIGVSSYREGDGADKQTLSGVDATLRYKPGTYLKVERAQSSGVGAESYTSIDGGYASAVTNTGTLAGQNATATRVELAADLAEVSNGSAKGKATAYYQDKEHGFSGPGQTEINGEALKQKGGSLEWAITNGTSLNIKGDSREAETSSVDSVEIAVGQKIGQSWKVVGGARKDSRTTLVTNNSYVLSQNGDRTDAQFKLVYAPAKADWEAYGFVQRTLSKTGTRDENDRAGVGGSWRVTDRTKINAEASGGNLGSAGLLGVEHRLDDRSNAYLNYVVEAESPDNAYRGRQGTLVSGTGYQISDEVRIFGETRVTTGAGPESLSRAFGADWAPNDRWVVSAKGEMGDISDPLLGDTRRKAVGGSVSYKEGSVKYTGGLEFRRDDNSLYGIRNTTLIRNTVAIQATPEWRLLGKANWAKSDHTTSEIYDGAYREVVLAAAYRPKDNDRWNALLKYTNMYNLPYYNYEVAPGPTQGQISSSGYDMIAKRLQVISLDAMYNIRPWLSVGGKYAIRRGEMKDTKMSGTWFSSKADLIAVRADWHFVKEWDAVAEIRRLRGDGVEQSKVGLLLAIYKHINDNVKVGVGYNWTDYSDDLANLSYQSRGWFFNVIGEF